MVNKYLTVPDYIGALDDVTEEDDFVEEVSQGEEKPGCSLLAVFGILALIFTVAEIFL